MICRGESTSHIPTHLRINDLTSWDTNSSGPGGSSILFMESGRVFVDGVKVTPERNAPAQLFSINMAGAEGKNWGASIKNVDALASTYTADSYVALNNFTGAFFEEDGIATPGSIAQTRDMGFGEYVAGEGPVIAYTFNFPPTELTSAVRFVAVGDSTGAGTGNRYAHIEENIVLRRSGATTSVIRKTNVRNDRSAGWGQNQYPASFVLLTGQAWAADMTLEAGDTVVSGGNVYLVILSDGQAGSTAPTTTNSIEVLGGVSYMYIGPVNANRAVVVLSGQAGFDMRWSGKIEMVSV